MRAFRRFSRALAHGESVCSKARFAEGLTLDEAKEVMGQLYAYCGFPRALNAAATLMKVKDLAVEENSRRDAETQRDELTQSPQSAQRGLEPQDNLCASAPLREIKTSRTSRTSREGYSAHGRTMAQEALAWMLSKPEITAPIVGSTSVKHIEEAVSALDITLSPEEIAALEAPYVPHIKTGAF